MSLPRRRRRIAAGLFAGVAVAITGNVLLLQGDASSRAAQRAKTERAHERAEKDRLRRLALKAGETPAMITPVILAPPGPRGQRATAAEPTPAQIERVGRFAPSASQLGDMRIPEDPEQRAAEVVRTVQRGLVERGYEPGTPDGVVGLVTRAAVMAYEHDNGLPLTGEPSDHVLSHMQTGRMEAAPRTGRPGRAPVAEQVIRSVQQSLSVLGYFAGRIDGFAGDDTVRAIREYEMDAGLVPTGRVSGPLVARLQRSTAGARPGAR